MDKLQELERRVAELEETCAVLRAMLGIKVNGCTGEPDTARPGFHSSAFGRIGGLEKLAAFRPLTPDTTYYWRSGDQGGEFKTAPPPPAPEAERPDSLETHWAARTLLNLSDPSADYFADQAERRRLYALFLERRCSSLERERDEWHGAFARSEGSVSDVERHLLQVEQPLQIKKLEAKVDAQRRELRVLNFDRDMFKAECAAVHALEDQLAAATQRAEEAEKRMDRQGWQSHCPFCGERQGNGTRDSADAWERAHFPVCSENPLRAELTAATTELAEARRTRKR